MWLPRDLQDLLSLVQRCLQMGWEQHSMVVMVKAQVLLSCPDLFLGCGAWLGGCVSNFGDLCKHRMKEQKCFWVLTRFSGCLSA